MKRTFTFYLLVVLIAFAAMPIHGFSQVKQDTSPPKEHSSRKQYDAFWKAHPEALKQYIEQEKIQGKLIDQLKSSKVRASLVREQKFIIPVVFHVFGNVQSNKQVTYALIEDALRRTNEDFAMQSVGQDLIHERFKDVVDVLPIEFRLANREPNGNICDGVNFYPTQTGFGNGSGYDSEIQKYAWDNYKYMNVYIMNDLYDDGEYTNSGVSWYPMEWMSDENLARVVYNGAYLGSNADENFRRIITHEFGHFLNLKHTFEGSCPEVDGGDHCDDTPPANKSQMGVDELNCKGEFTNTQNFMNYTDDYEMYTKDQVLRMTAALNSPSRVSLWQDDNLLATGVSDGFDPGKVVTYNSYKFKEALVNDGSILTQLVVSLTDGAEFSNETFVEGTHFKTLNMPAGLQLTISRTAPGEASLSLVSKAIQHERSHSAKGIVIEFLQPAFTSSIDQINNTRMAKFEIDFRDVYETKYLSFDNVKVDDANNWKWFFLGEGDAEYGAWKCNISELPDVKFKLETYSKAVVCQEGNNKLAPLNYGDEISSSSHWFAYDKYPNQPTVYATDYTDWLGKTAYIGVQFEAYGDTYNGWMSATIAADASSFIVHDAAYYTKPNASLLAGQAHEAMLKFDADTIMEDAINNNGLMGNKLIAKLMNSHFAVDANQVLEKNTHYTISGLPAGLNEEIKVLDNDYISVELKGYAESHAKLASSEISIEFKDVLFDVLSALEIKNGSSFKVHLKFLDDYKVVYKDIDDLTVNKDNTWEKFSLDDDAFYYGAWFNEGLCRFETYKGAVVGYESKYLNAKPVDKGVPIDGASIWSFGQDYPHEIYLTSMEAGYDEFKGADTYIGIQLVKNEMKHYGWIHISMNADGSEYSVLDWAYNQQPYAPIIAGETTIDTSSSITISNTEFVEPYSNDGSLEGKANLFITGDQFALAEGTVLTQGTHFTLNNLPEGLQVQLKGVNANEMALAFTGQAIANTQSNNGEIEVLLKDNVFVFSAADSVKNSTFKVSTRFKEPWDIVYTDLGGIVASESNTFTWFGPEHTSHGFGAWWYNKDGHMKFESYENYVICEAGTSNLKPLAEGSIIGANSEQWYQGMDYPDEPDLDNNDFHKWLGKEAYVGVRMQNGSYTHYGWVRIAVAADAMSYTVLDYAYNDQPGALIIVGQKVVGNEAIVEASQNIFRETYANDGHLKGENHISIQNGKFSLASGLLSEGVHYVVSDLPTGLQLDLSAINADSLKLVVSGVTENHLAINDIDFIVSLKDAAFADHTAADVKFSDVSFHIGFRNVYSVVYVDNDDMICNKDNVWNRFDVIPGVASMGSWCYEYTNLKLETYNNKVVCHKGTFNIQLLAEQVVLDGNTADWTTYDKYPNQLNVYNRTYTDWKGKEGYLGIQIEDDGYFFYGWLRVSVEADGTSYTILDYAYNETPNQAILTGAKVFTPLLPVVAFTADKLQIFTSESIAFTDHTTYQPTGWSWVFEGAQPDYSSDQNPVVNYVEEGVYDVRLTATNKDGEASLTKSSFITVYHEGPAIAAFTADKQLVNAGEIVQFTDESVGVATAWKWTFEGGEPANSILQNPEVSYNTPGTYKVVLIAENSFGLSQEVKKAFITVQDFSVNGYCEAKHVYADNWLDINQVTLAEIDNASGLSEYSDFSSQIARLTVSNSYDMNVSYGNNGWPSNSLFVWVDWDQSKTFEESERVFYGDNSDEDNLQHFQLTVPANAKDGFTLMRLRTAYSSNCNPCGTINYAGETEDYSIMVVVPSVPVANFIISKPSIVKGEKVLFRDISTNNPSSWSWEFEGSETLVSNRESVSVTYNHAGTYRVKLSVANGHGSDSKVVESCIRVTDTSQTPDPEFTTEATHVSIGQQLCFINKTAYDSRSTYLWSFEGGVPATSTEINPSVSYQSLGYFPVSLRVTTPDGSKEELRNTYITVREHWKPVAEFKVDKNIILVDGQIQFTDLSGNEPTSWVWEFEGGSPASSTERNPQVAYTNAGTYKVKLTASNALGAGLIEKVACVVVNEFDPSAYCVANNVYNNNWLDINHVSIGAIDNASGISEYSDFTHLSTELNRNGTYDMSVSYGNYWSPNSLFVWIDWNQDKSFDDSERVYFGRNYDRDGLEAFQITVPASALKGYTLMRLRTAYSSYCDPCGTVRYAGEVEDYTIRVTDDVENASVNFRVSKLQLEEGKTVLFTDLSDANAISWAWEFSGGTPSVSGLQNPFITYANAGVYDVSLKVTYADGSDSIAKGGYITVSQAAVDQESLSIRLSNNTLDEDADLYTLIGQFYASDGIVDNPLSFELLSDVADNDSFTIEGSSLSLNDNLDYETKREYSIRIRTTVKVGISSEQAFTIRLTQSLDTDTDLNHNDECILYPNPVIEKLVVNCPGMVGIKIFDAIGKAVFVHNNSAHLSELKINFSEYKKGLYIVRIELENGQVIMRKIIK